MVGPVQVERPYFIARQDAVAFIPFDEAVD
jgi:hypothetical protein